jgi:uncharacterized protein YkwD
MSTYLPSILRTVLGACSLRSSAAALTLFLATLTIAVPGASANRVRHAPRLARIAQSCANAKTPALSASSNAIRAAVVCLINRERVSRGLPTLHDQSLLGRSAQGWTDQMIHSDAFSHGSNFAARITATGYTWSAAGENIATGFTTPQAVVTGWMGSAGHCDNILDPSFNDVGTGVGRSVGGQFPSGSVWTQDFALRMGQRSRSSDWGPANGCPYAS